MHGTGRHSVRERIIAAEVMKLERQQAAARRGGAPSSPPELFRSAVGAAPPGKRALGR